MQEVHSLDRIKTKYLLATSDGYLVEGAFIDTSRKYVICVSTQIGCAIGRIVVDDQYPDATRVLTDGRDRR